MSSACLFFQKDVINIYFGESPSNKATVAPFVPIDIISTETTRTNKSSAQSQTKSSAQSQTKSSAQSQTKSSAQSQTKSSAQSQTKPYVVAPQRDYIRSIKLK